MRCIECGQPTARLRKTVVRTELRGVALEVPFRAEECSSCGFQTIPAKTANEFGRALDVSFRRKTGLLSPDQIRQARERLGMTQQQFAEYLGVGIASVKRWELGYLQDKSSDDLLRMKTDPDSAVRNLYELCRRLGQTARIEIAAPRKPETAARGGAARRRATSI